MNSFIHADIFFFVTTIVVVLVGIGSFIIFVQIIRLLLILRDIAEKVRNETVLISDDLNEFRSRVRHRRFNIMAAITFFQGIFKLLKRNR